MNITHADFSVLIALINAASAVVNGDNNPDLHCAASQFLIKQFDSPIPCIKVETEDSRDEVTLP